MAAYFIKRVGHQGTDLLNLHVTMWAQMKCTREIELCDLHCVINCPGVHSCAGWYVKLFLTGLLVCFSETVHYAYMMDEKGSHHVDLLFRSLAF